jgi:hypothetical protein
VVGENKEGQLGSSFPDMFRPDWIHVQRFTQGRAVLCGPKCTFVWA